MRYIILLVVIATACAQPSSKSVEAYKTLATEKLGGTPDFVLNASSTYVLCKVEQKGTSLQPRNSIKYMVVKIDDSKEVLNRAIDGGTVKWSSEYEIAEYIVPGNMRQGETQDDYTKRFDVRTGGVVEK